jgi:hypothetical protein
VRLQVPDLDSFDPWPQTTISCWTSAQGRILTTACDVFPIARYGEGEYWLFMAEECAGFLVSSGGQ